MTTPSSTPVLTKTEQRHSLSAKKGPTKGLRNILAQPNLNFWPVINVNRYPELVTKLNTILPLSEPSKGRIPWYVLKNVPKKDRASARKEMLEKVPPKPDILKFMVIGINAVTRALEKNNICSVLLDANVEPPLIIKHVIVMAVNNKVPILLLPILKTVMLEKMGFATTAFALKQEVTQCSDNVCYSLYKLIAEAFKDFEPPEYLPQHFKSDEVADKSTMCEAKITSMDSDTNLNISKSEEKSVTKFTDVYKYRSSRSERAFIPPVVSESYQVSQIPSDEFIGLSSDLDPVDDKTRTSTWKNRRYVNIGKEEKCTKKSEGIEDNSSFKSINNNADSTEHTKNILKRCKNDEPKYLSLKLKCIQGSNKRKKATKFAKKKK